MKAAQLRQSILQAAVQGKLVLQNPQDEPASELLKRIQTEKSHLIKNGKIKKEKPLPSVSEEEKPYDLPDGWEWCRLGNVILQNIGGGTPSKSVSEYWNGDVPWASVKDLSGKYLSSTRDRITKKGLLNSTSNLIPSGNVIVCTRMGLGKISINTIKLAINQDLRALFVSKYINIHYFIYYYQGLSIVGSGMTVKGITIDELNNLFFPLPPLAEQQRIVAKVDELMTLCDELKAVEKELDSLEANLADYLPKSILQAAVRGKLVPQSIHDEPASELLKRIQEEKSCLIKAGKLKKEKPLPPISEEEKPYDLPDGWEWCRVGDICSVNPRNNLQDDIQVSFIPMTLISSDYFGGHQQEARKWGEVKQGFTHFAENDVVLAKITPCFQNGKSCIVKNLKSGFGAGTTELHVLRSLGVDPTYLLNFLKSPEFLAYVG